MKGAFQAVRVKEPRYFSKAAHERSWEMFSRKGTSHSENAATLVEILNRCEREGVGYVLKALPGKGYYIRPFNCDDDFKADGVDKSKARRK
jgi:hypothetical protein